MGNSLCICNCGESSSSPIQYMEKEDFHKQAEIDALKSKKKKMDITGEAWKYAIRDIKGAIKVKATSSEDEDSPT